MNSKKFLATAVGKASGALDGTDLPRGYPSALTPAASSSVVGKVQLKANSTKQLQAHVIDFEHAKPPGRSYGAELVGLDFRDGEVFMLFGQRAIFGEEIDSVLSIRMPGASPNRLIKSIDESALVNIAYASKLGSTELFQYKSNPKQTAKLTANVVRVAVAGHEACMDFYQASPIVLANANNEKNKHVKHLDIEPVVRVDLHTTEFMALIRKIRELSSEIPHDSE